MTENAPVIAIDGPSGSGKGTLAAVEELIDSLGSKGCRVLVDPKGRDFHRYRHAFCLTPNQSEFAVVAGSWSSESEFLDKATALRRELEKMAAHNLSIQGYVTVTSGCGAAVFASSQPRTAAATTMRKA